MSQLIPFEPPTRATETISGYPVSGASPVRTASSPAWSEPATDRLDDSQRQAMRQSVYALLTLVGFAGLVLAIGAMGAAAKFQAILAFAYLGVTADALVLRMSLRSMPTASRSLYASVVTYVVINLLLLMGIILWASQMDRSSGWLFPATYGPHIPTMFGVAAVLVAGLSRSAAAIWVMAIGTSILHAAAHAVVNDKAGFFFPGPHLLYSLLALVGTAGVVCYLQRCFRGPSAD